MTYHPRTAVSMTYHPRTVVTITYHPGDVVTITYHPGTVVSITHHPRTVVSITHHPGTVVSITYHPGTVVTCPLRSIASSPDLHSQTTPTVLFSITNRQNIIKPAQQISPQRTAHKQNKAFNPH